VQSASRSKIADNVWLTRSTVAGAMGNNSALHGASSKVLELAKHLLSVLAIYIRAVTNAQLDPTASGVCIVRLALISIYLATTLHLDSIRQPAALAPSTRIVSLARMPSTVNGAKILVYVKKRARPEIAQSLLVILVMPTANLLEIRAVVYAIT